MFLSQKCTFILAILLYGFNSQIGNKKNLFSIKIKLSSIEGVLSKYLVFTLEYTKSIGSLRVTEQTLIKIVNEKNCTQRIDRQS